MLNLQVKPPPITKHDVSYNNSCFFESWDTDIIHSIAYSRHRFALDAVRYVSKGTKIIPLKNIKIDNIMKLF